MTVTRAHMVSAARWQRLTRQPRRLTNVAARRCLPEALVPALVDARSWIGRRRPGRWEEAQESMRFLMGSHHPANEIDALAHAYLRRASWRAESRWRPGLINRQDVVGLEHLDAALAEGKGCLLSFVHHGDYAGYFPSLAAAGQPVVAVGTASLFDPDSPLWHEQQRRVTTSVRGATVMDVSRGSAGIRELLSMGQSVAVALDFPGHTPTRMFGHDLLLSSGGTRIAMETDAPVVVMTSRRHPIRSLGGSSVVLSEPLRPRDFAGPEQLRAEMARQLEQSILAWPEATDEPLRMDKRHLVKAPTEYRAAG